MNKTLEFVDGQWRPAVPLPMFYGPVVRCQCRRWFLHLSHGLRNARYERHYRYAHLDAR